MKAEHTWEFYKDDYWKCSICSAIQATTADDDFECLPSGKFLLKGGKILMKKVFFSFEEAEREMMYLKGNKKGKLEIVSL